MASKPNRTASGGTSQAARNKYGDQSGAYPVFDHKSAMAAIHEDMAAKKAVSKARKVDRQS